MNGDNGAVAGALYCLTLELAENMKMSPVAVWKQFIKIYKKVGTPETFEF